MRIAVPRIGFERASVDEMRKLRNIVGAHPWLSECNEESFARTFVVVGFQFSRAEPDKGVVL